MLLGLQQNSVFTLSVGKTEARSAQGKPEHGFVQYVVFFSKGEKKTRNTFLFLGADEPKYP